MENFKRIDNHWINSESPWNLVRGKYLFENPKTLNKDSKENNLLSLTLNGVLNKDMDSGGGLRPDSYDSYQIFEKNDLVFKLIDLENVKTSRVGWVHERGLMSPVYIRLKPKEDKINTRYFYYYFFDLYLRQIFNSIGSGIRSSLSGTNLLELLVPNPTYEEQTQIVDYLDKKTKEIDELVTKIEKKVELLKEQKTSLINEVVTKGINPNVETKDSGVEWLGQVPKHWKIIRLKLLGSFSNGLSKSSEYFGKGFPFYSYGDIYNNPSLPDVPSGMVESDGSDQKKCSVERGDVFFTRTSESTDDIGVTSTCLKTLPHSTFSGFIIRFRPHKERFLPEYSKYLFQNHYKKTFIESRMNIVTRSSLSQSILGNVLVMFPEEKEAQQEIIEYLDHQTHTIDKIILQEEKRIELLKEYKQSLISEVVTGKKKVVS